MSEIVPEIFEARTFEPIDNITIIKVGTSVLQHQVKMGTVGNRKAFENIGIEINKQDEAGNHPTLITSGAVRRGMTLTGIEERPDIKTEMHELRLLSAIAWDSLVGTWKINTGRPIVFPFQITRDTLGADDPPERKSRRKFYETLHTSFEHGYLPIGNEADAVADEEISFGDNDILSAMLAKGIAESALFGSNVRLVILTDVDGFYEDENDPSTLIPVVENIKEYSHLAGEPGPDGRGGMESKLEAGEIITSAGIEMWIAKGTEPNVIEKAFAGETGTYFPATARVE